MSTYSLVTVAHSHDQALMELQARSVGLYGVHAPFDEIIVVDNSAPGQPTLDRAALLRAYGAAAGMVRYLPPDALGSIPGSPAGWWTQQVRKLQVSTVVATERYVLLDAKNHLVAPLYREFLEAYDGVACTRHYGYRQHPLLPKLQRVLAFMGLSDTHADLFITTAPPFTVHTSIARMMVAALGADFAGFMLRHELTEFFWYYAFLLKITAGAVPYTFDQVPTQTVWPHLATPEETRGLITAAKRLRSPVFGVHRGAARPLLETGAADALVDFWTEAGLFESCTDARTLLAAIGP